MGNVGCKWLVYGVYVSCSAIEGRLCKMYWFWRVLMGKLGAYQGEHQKSDLNWGGLHVK